MCKHSQKTALTLPFCQFFLLLALQNIRWDIRRPSQLWLQLVSDSGCIEVLHHEKKVLLSSESCKTISWNPRIKKMTLPMEMNNSFKHCPHIKQITYCVVSSWEEIQIPRGCVRKGIQHKNLTNPIRRVTCCGGPLRISEQPKVASFFGHYKLIFGCQWPFQALITQVILLYISDLIIGSSVMLPNALYCYQLLLIITVCRISLTFSGLWSAHRCQSP